MPDVPLRLLIDSCDFKSFSVSGHLDAVQRLASNFSCNAAAGSIMPRCVDALWIAHQHHLAFTQPPPSSSSSNLHNHRCLAPLCNSGCASVNHPIHAGGPPSY